MKHSVRQATRASAIIAPLAGCAVFLYACQDAVPTAPRTPPVYMAQAVQCTVNVAQQSMDCTSGAAAVAASPDRAMEAAHRAMTGGPADVSARILGGQHTYVTLTSQNVFVDAGNVLHASVKVQNLTSVAMGSTNGSTYDGTGVDVFFDTPPGAPVTINNPTGTGLFLHANQTYFQFPQLVPANGATALQPWLFGFNGPPVSFTFIVYVSAALPTDPAVVVIPPHTFPMISSGYDHICAIRSGNQAYCWGGDSAGQLGDGRAAAASLPVSVLGDHLYSTVAAGLTHGCGIEQSTLGAYCWGGDALGALGDGSTTTESSPVAVSGNRAWAAIGAGSNHSCAIESATNKAYCWGDNTHGQLGSGSLGGNSTIPSLVVGGLTFVAISSGHDHSCALTAGGAAYCWGANASQQIGNNSTTDQPSPTLVLGGHSWKKIAAGGDHSCGIDSFDDAWCWGRDQDGELGDGFTTDQGMPVQTDMTSGMGTVKIIAAGSTFTCAIDKTAGAVGWCWGNGSAGQLGDGSLASPITTPVDIVGFSWNSISAGESHTCGIDTSSHAYCWGAGALGQIGDGALDTLQQPTMQVGSDTYSAIASGGNYSCGISVSKAGTGWCWGFDSASTLADGFLLKQAAPLGVLGFHQFASLAASQLFTCGIDGAGAAWCWGDNAFDELGTGNETSQSLPTAVTGGHVFSQISSFSFESVCARVSGASDQSVYCWGLNSDGEIGDNTNNNAPNPVLVAGPVTTFSAVSAGFDHTCAVRSTGATYCWGNNTVGQLGDGTMNGELQPNLIPVVSFQAIGAGDQFSCAIETAAAHHLWCWGDNTFGQLASGSFGGTVTAPATSISTRSWTQVTLGAFYGCALEQGTNNAYCWGSNLNGQLGDNTSTNRAAPTLVSGAVTSFATISAGKPTAGTTCASTAAGVAYCWGLGYGKKPTLVATP